MRHAGPIFLASALRADIPPRDPLPGRLGLEAVAVAGVVVAAVAGVLWLLRRSSAPDKGKRVRTILLVAAVAAALLIAVLVAVPKPKWSGGPAGGREPNGPLPVTTATVVPLPAVSAP